MRGEQLKAMNEGHGMMVSRTKMSPQPNLQCHEEEVFLMDSPCSSGRTASNNTTNGHQSQHYYLLFGQNTNELSLERKRLCRMNLRADVHQIEECRQRGVARTVDVQQQNVNSLIVASDGGPVETPKNGAKVLGKIDVNIPVNGSRLSLPFQQQPSQHQQHRISSNRMSRTHRQPPTQYHPAQIPPIGTRKRRADESEERLNLKERLWVCADVDRAIHLDNRCLKNLLEAEQQVQVTEAQIHRQQQSGQGGEQGVDVEARSRLVEWLNEVCDGEHTDYVVLPLAVAFLDRVLAAKFVPRRNLQVLGAACLLLASKMKAPQPILASRLAHFAMVKTEELLDWEMIIVNQLHWNLLQTTAFEFFDQLLVRCPVLETLREDFALCMHRMQRDLHLAIQLPSIQASICLLFCAFRSRRRHLLEESQQSIRRHFGFDQINSLIPLVGSIATLIGGTATNMAADIQKLAGWTERQRAMFPPSSKRMSLERPTSAIEFAASDQGYFQDGLQQQHSAIYGVRSLSDSKKNSTTIPHQPQPPIDTGFPSSGNAGASPSNSNQTGVDDESSRSSSNSSNESTKTKVMVDDSGYRSSEAISPLYDRKAKDFGPLF